MKFFILFLFSSIFCIEKPNVYFSKTISPERMVFMYKKLGVNLRGKIGLKVHSGEPEGPYFLRPDFLQKIYNYTHGTFLECNVAYGGERLNTSNHTKVLHDNGWFDNGRNIVIMDEDPTQDITLNTSEHHNKINITYVGQHLEEYDSCVVLSHFKGHQMGGYGGALKQLSIGFASTQGKMWIHSAGVSRDYRDFRTKCATQKNFTDSMADAASAVVNYFKQKGDIVYINVMTNISLACDCAGKNAPEPQIKDIGILASTDPVAIDQACFDLINKTNETGTEPFIEQINNKLGLNTIKQAEYLGLGSREYNFIDVSDERDDTDDNGGDNSKGSFIDIPLKLMLLILMIM